MIDELQEWVRATESKVDGAQAKLAEVLIRAPFDGLIACAEHRAATVRAAAAEALPSRTEHGAAALGARLSRDREGEVRVALARALSHMPRWGHDELYRTLIDDAEWTVREAIAVAACDREALREELLIALVEDDDEDVRCAIATRLAQLDPSRALPGLIENIAGDSVQTRRACAVALDQVIKGNDGLPNPTMLPGRDVMRRAAANLRETGRRRFSRVIAELERRGADVAFVELPDQRGVDLAREARQGKLERAFEVEPMVAALLATIERPTCRAAVLLGESGVGKTAIVHELVFRLNADPRGPWTIVRMSPSDFLIGTTYLGEWQTQLQKLIEALRSSRRTLLIVPSVHQLSQIGSTGKSDENVASMLAPHIESGAIAVIGESSPREFAEGMGRFPSTRSAWTSVDVPSMSAAATLRVLRAITAQQRVAVSDSLLERVLDYAEMMLPSAAQPGRSAALLRRALAQCTGDTLSQADVLAELTRCSGVPRDLLDDELPLDLDALRGFLTSRVMGQPESIEAVVDVVTLIKAGLTDPGKPLAVLFFVGPTGVGKTELARALAERIFGDPNRLVRFDMSEYATHDSFERLIGARNTTGTLTGAVRDKPFSVLLFDEIEKAHQNVFDLCLQLFDAGRLTDGEGRTTDFRRTVLILTSNVGSAVAVEAPLGFSEVPPRAPDESEVLRAMRSFFRPEFLNRIDRVVVFRPLSLETAEKIAQRELALVLRRGGIQRRGLVVDIDPELTALLLRRGYNQAFGARPLKRTIERLVLQPVARAIASGAARPGSVLRLSVRSDDIDVRMLEPEHDAPLELEHRPNADQAQVCARTARAVGRVEALERDAGALKQRASELLATSNTHGFWDRRAAALATLDELHRIDSVLQRLQTLGSRVRASAEQALRARDARLLAELEQRCDELELETQLLERLVQARDSLDLADAWLIVTEVKSQGDELSGVDKLTRMYMGWAKRRRFEVAVVSERCGGDPREHSVVLEIQGAGAFMLLRGENGVHVVQGEGPRTRTRAHAQALRDVIRVDVVRAVDAPQDRRHVECRTLSNVVGRWIAAPQLEVTARHKESSTSAVVWTDRERARAIEDGAALLAAMVAARSAGKTGRDTIRRRYEIAPVARVRGNGIQAKLASVLAGEIDRFLLAATERQPALEAD